MLNGFLKVADQFDLDNLEKQASWLSERQEQLASAPPSDFAVVIFDGRNSMRKYPIQTEDDILMSKEALDQSADELPDEIVKVAQYHIDLAGREILGRSLYESVAHHKTNVVYAGLIDKTAYEHKCRTALRKHASNHALVGGKLRVEDEQGVKVAETMLATRSLKLSPENHMEACMQLVKRAQELGVKLERREVVRFGREGVSEKFASHIARRKQAAPSSFHHFYDQLLEEAPDMGLRKVAKALSILDDISGFTPEDGAFNKIANNFPPYMDVVFPYEEEKPIALSKTAESLDKVAEFFGEDFANTYKEDATRAISTLSSVERAHLSKLVG